MHAAQHSNIKMLKLLLKQGARLKDTDELGFNALDYAIGHRNKANAAFLRSMGLKPNIQH
jgi:ankyrin repeat protein